MLANCMVFILPENCRKKIKIKMVYYDLKLSSLALLLFACIFDFGKMTDDEMKQQIIFPGQARSEHDLPICKKREVCSIVHKRFWFPKQIERFCRCDNPDSIECPITWSDQFDNYTMHLNNRAQLKFCESIHDLPHCPDNDTHYLKIENRTIPVTNPINKENDEVSPPSASVDENDDMQREHYVINSNIECYCPAHHIWIPSSYESNSTGYSIASYRCAPLPKCKPDEFCGFERADHYSIYYHCTCPVGYLCLRRNDSKYQAKEAFFDGFAYKAQCTQFL